MKKINLIILFCTMVIVLAAFGAREVKAAGQDTVWNYEKQITETSGAFTYHAYLSGDETEVWIHKIDIDKSKNYSFVSIPETMDGKSVTRLGYTKKTFNAYDYINARSEYATALEYEDALRVVQKLSNQNKNLFDEFIDVNDKRVGTDEGELDGIKEITIPTSVEVIQPGAFAGLDYVTVVAIPKKVTVIGEETFYGCDRLETIKLPAGLKEIDITALIECPKLGKIELSSKNKVYSVKNKCIITKKNKTLIYALNCDGTLKIPEGVKTIEYNALGNTAASEVHIPASVTKISDGAFFDSTDQDLRSNKKIKNVTVSKKNKVYAKDGQCIYNKKDKSLTVAIPNDNKVLIISDKVEKLRYGYSLVNCNVPKESLKKVVFPKTFKYVDIEALQDITVAGKTYFKGEKPPKLTYDADDLSGVLGISSDIYVPKKSAKIYKKWLKKYNEYNARKFHTF